MQRRLLIAPKRQTSQRLQRGGSVRSLNDNFSSSRFGITLSQLHHIQALARYRHFGHAAEGCAVTQSALSIQTRALENELDVELVERRPGDAPLTEIGVGKTRR